MELGVRSHESLATAHTVLAPAPPVRAGPGTPGAGADPLAPPKVKVLEGAGLRPALTVPVRAFGPHRK